jgi:hypothetical protein
MGASKQEQASMSKVMMANQISKNKEARIGRWEQAGKWKQANENRLTRTNKRNKNDGKQANSLCCGRKKELKKKIKTTPLNTKLQNT